MSALALAKGPVTVCQLEAELDAVLDLYRKLGPLRVLEIGTASGGTLYHWLRNSVPGTRVVTVDLPNPDYPSQEHRYREWLPDGVTVEQIRGDSHDPAIVEACRMLGPFEWLFIDGCHVYEDARADWLNYRPLVSRGGVVLFHDIALKRRYEDGREAGVHKLWRELQAEGWWTREFRADPRLEAYGIGAVKV